MNLTKTEFCKLVENILESHTREMEGYSYFGSNPGVPEDMYEDIAEEIYNVLAEGANVGYCERGDHCCCGGDLPAIQRTCSSWREPK